MMGNAMELPILRIVVVDDSRDSADTLAATLECLGQHVRVAYDGATALPVIQEMRPDIAILDIGMPGLSGHELAKRVRMEPDLGGVMLVALSGWGLPADRKFALASGFDEHYAKPIGIEQLEQIVREAASRSAGSPAGGAGKLGAPVAEVR